MRLGRRIQKPPQAALHPLGIFVGQRLSEISQVSKIAAILSPQMPSYAPVGRCIYCGKTKLPPGVARFGDEHIVPYALGGNLVLPEASCRECEKIINREIENPILRQEWGNLRIKGNFPSRNKSSRKHKTHVVMRDTEGLPITIPLTDYSAPVIMYKFDQARILSGLPPGLDDLRWTITILDKHDDEMEMQRKYPKWDKAHTFVPYPDRFARFVAKIAYGYFVGEYGIDGFMPFVLNIILGRSNDYYYTVGGSHDILDGTPGATHTFSIAPMVVKRGRILINVGVRLFSSVATPGYHVIVGEIDLKNPQHVSAFEENRTKGKIIVTPPKLG